MTVQTKHYVRPVLSGARGQYVNPVSPYLTRTLFASAALTYDLSGQTRVGPTATFVLDGDLVVVEPGRTLSQVEVDFGHGQGYRAVSVGAPVTVSYGSPGEKTATLRAQVDGSTYYSRFTVYAETDLGRGGESPDVLSPWLTASRTYYASGAGDGAGVNDEYNGSQAAQYQYGIYYGQGHTQLTKPVLFLDGFDLEENRGVQDIYDKFLNPQDQPAPTLADILKDQGYDLVIVDWRRSQDFVQRNAYAAADVIAWVNGQLPPGNEIAAVIGSSMGGLVGRYALLYMEDQGLDHNTKLFVSYDSPQQGANIPIGFQWLIRDVKFYSGMAGDFWKVITSPSARQMLVYNTQHGKNDPFRGALYDDFAAMGDYPSDDIRLVAVANGSGSGLLQLKKTDGPYRLQPSGLLLQQVTAAGFFAASVKSVYKAWAAPERTTQDRLIYERQDKLCLPWPIGCSIGLGNERRNVTEVNPFDSAPGGWRGSASSIESAENNWKFAVAALLTLGGSGVGVDVFAELHAFVPTVSALDYNTTSLSRAQLIAERFDSQNLSQVISRGSSSRTPFDDFYLPGDGDESNENQEHVSGNEAIAQFLLEQLTWTPPPPQPFSAGISGPTWLAVGQTGTWRANAAGGQTPYAYRWYQRRLRPECPANCLPDDDNLCTMAEPTCLGDFKPAGPNATGPQLSRYFDRVGEFELALTLTDGAGTELRRLYWVSVSGGGRVAGGASAEQQPTPAEGAQQAAGPLDGAARSAQPRELALAAFPNPFASASVIRFELPETTGVRLTVHDVLGREVATLVDDEVDAGRHTARLDAADLPSGTYLVRLTAGSFVETQRVTLVR